MQSDWVTIALDSYYFKPVVITGNPTTNGDDMVTVRIRNVRHGQVSSDVGACHSSPLLTPATLKHFCPFINVL